MQRYFVEKECIKDNYAEITGKDYHHIKDVMRMKPNDKIILLDNSGNEYLCEIININQKVSLNILNCKNRFRAKLC